MEFADNLTARIEGDTDSKRPLNALICFTERDTAKDMIQIVDRMIRHKTGKSSIIILNLIDEEQASRMGDEEAYKSILFSEIAQWSEMNRQVVRVFVKQSTNHVEDIMQTAETYESNFILLGVEYNTLNTSLWRKYIKLKEEGATEEKDYNCELGKETTRLLRQMTSTLLFRNEHTIALYIPNNLEKAEHIFAPVLKREDAISLSYLYQFAKFDDAVITVWDAIGIFQNDQKLNRMLQSLTKKTDGRIVLWDNNKKITPRFIQQQDLIIAGYAGWEKLICTPLGWNLNLPSVLLIKEKQIRE